MGAWAKNTDNINTLPNNTQCVNGKASWKIGICKHCGKTFEKRTTWQLFCKEQCRLDFHGVTSIAQLYKRRKKG